MIIIISYSTSSNTTIDIILMDLIFVWLLHHHIGVTATIQQIINKMKSNKVCGVFDECIPICNTNSLYQQGCLYFLLVSSKMIQ